MRCGVPSLIGSTDPYMLRIGVEPHLVQCNSCQSRIRIRNPNLIGKRVACPKCKAEVLITPPAPPKIHVARADMPQVDSTALTKDGFGDEALGLLSSQNADGAVGGETPFSNFDFSDIDSALAQQSQANAAQATQAAYSSEVERQNPSSTAEQWIAPERVAPTEQWSSRSTAQRRQYLIIGFLGASSCLIAVLSFILFLRWYQSEPTKIADAKKQEQQQKPNDQQANLNNQVNGGSEDKPNEKANGQDSVEGQGSSDSSVAPSDSNAKPAETRIEIEPESTATQNPPKADREGTVASTEPKTNGPLTNGPLANGTPLESPSADTTVAIVKADTPPQIQQLLKIIGEPQVVPPQQKLIVPEKPKVTDLEIETGNRELTMTPVANLAELASQRNVWGLSLPNRRLSDVLAVWNTIVGLPVEINPISLTAADFDFDQSFDVELKETTASAGIDQLAAALGLKAESRDNRFWLLSAPVPDEKKLPRSIKIDDLVSSPEQQSWLAETIESIFPGTASSLEYVDGKLISKPDGLDHLTWFTLVRMLENWRQQRGLASGLPQYRKESLRVPFVPAAKVAAFNSTLTDVNSTARPLAQLVNRQCFSAGVTCWVDWAALEYLPVRLAAGEAKSISPQTQRISVTHNRTLKQFLSELDFELGMVTMVIDEKTIMITSRFAYRRMQQVFVIPSGGKTIDAFWSQYFRPLTPIDSEGISNVVLRTSPDGEFIFVKCCWPTLQFE